MATPIEVGARCEMADSQAGVEQHQQIAEAHPRSRTALGTVLLYGAPLTGVAWMLLFVQFFFLKFATDTLGLAPGAVGVVFALVRAWDAVFDPLVGVWSDGTRSRLGRRRPWMLWGVPLLGIPFAAIYAPPQGLDNTLLLVWVTLALIAFHVGLTIYTIPHQALGAELTNDHHDRSRIFGVRHVATTVGMMLAFAGIQYVSNAPDRRAAALALGAGVGVVASLFALVTPLYLRERPEYQGRGASSGTLRALLDVLRNRHARLLLVVWFIEMAGAGVLGVLSPYIAQYVLRRPDLIGPLPAIFVVCNVLSVPVWVRLSRRFGKRDVWIASMLGVALSFGCTVFVPAGNWQLFAGLLVVAGFSMGCGGTVGPSILADVIDCDEHATSERKEGAYSAAWGFALKAGSALVIMLTGVALQLSGFAPNAEQSMAAEWTLRGLYGGLPFVMFSIGALIFRRFSLDQHEHARILSELEGRAAIKRRGGQADAVG